jgi:hypothetical protein
VEDLSTSRSILFVTSYGQQFLRSIITTSNLRGSRLQQLHLQTFMFAKLQLAPGPTSTSSKGCQE